MCVHLSIRPFLVTFVRILYLFEVLRRFQHCPGHIMMGSSKGRGNQYIQFVRAVYCKLPTNGKPLPAFPLEAMPGIEPQPQRFEFEYCKTNKCKVSRIFLVNSFLLFKI